MLFRWNPREYLALFSYVVKWFCLVAPVAAAIGSACALFLWVLESVTNTRLAQPWLLFLLPSPERALASYTTASGVLPKAAITC